MDPLKRIEHAMDRQSSARAAPVTAPVRVVGFDAPSVSLDSSGGAIPHSAPIPVKAPAVPIMAPSSISPTRLSASPPKRAINISSSLPSDFITYKSQLPGWSGTSPSPSPPSMMGFAAMKGAKPASSRKGHSTDNTPPDDGPRAIPANSLPNTSYLSNFTSTKNIIPLNNDPTALIASAAKPPPVPKKQQNQQGQQGQNQQQNQKGQQKQQQSQGQNQPKQQQQKKEQQRKGGDAAQAQPQQQQGASKASGSSGPKTPRQPAPMQFDDTKRRQQAEKRKIVQHAPVPVSHQVQLFSHLDQYERSSSLTSQVPLSGAEIHPAILKLGLAYADWTISGSNARAVAMCEAFKKVITDFATPPNKTFHRELDNKLKPQIQFLVDCRPLSISMGNAINSLKQQMTQTVNMTEQAAKQFLCNSIDDFVQTRIVVAGRELTNFGVSKINNGDVILTYARSYVVEMIIKKAFDEGKQFKVIVVDSRPKLEGKGLLVSLAKHGVSCTYMHFNAISYTMQKVTKVFVGAHSMLSNGALVSRVGTAGVASMASIYNVPVIVCCETYKFSERVQLDSICFNQLGDPDELVRDGLRTADEKVLLSDWRSHDQLKLLNLMYDVTPMTNLALVVCEYGLIPPSSVPAILREYRKDMIQV